jgi:hypothetical protein
MSIEQQRPSDPTTIPIRLLVEEYGEKPSPAVEMSIAALESAKMDLFGRKPS